MVRITSFKWVSFVARLTATVKASLGVDTDSIATTDLVAALIDVKAANEGVPIIALLTLAHLARVSLSDTLSIVSTRSRFTQTERRFRDGNTSLDGVDGLSESWLAGAPLDIVYHHTLSICSTWVGLALLQRSGTWDGRRITLIPGQTVTDWSVSNHSTSRVWTTLIASALGSILDTSDKRIASLASGT